MIGSESFVAGNRNFLIGHPGNSLWLHGSSYDLRIYQAHKTEYHNYEAQLHGWIA